MFPHDSVQKYGSNVTAENIHSQVDEDGHMHMLTEEIVDHQKDETAV